VVSAMDGGADADAGTTGPGAFLAATVVVDLAPPPPPPPPNDPLNSWPSDERCACAGAAGGRSATALDMVALEGGADDDGGSKPTVLTVTAPPVAPPNDAERA
jgi:hypothetical protein